MSAWPNGSADDSKTISIRMVKKGVVRLFYSKFGWTDEIAPPGWRPVKEAGD